MSSLYSQSRDIGNSPLFLVGTREFIHLYIYIYSHNCLGDLFIHQLWVSDVTKMKETIWTSMHTYMSYCAWSTRSTWSYGPTWLGDPPWNPPGQGYPRSCKLTSSEWFGQSEGNGLYVNPYIYVFVAMDLTHSIRTWPYITGRDARNGGQIF